MNITAPPGPSAPRRSRRASPWSFRARLLFLLFLAVLPALGLVVSMGAEQRQHAREKVQADTLRLAGMAASQQAHVIERTRELLTLLAHLPAVRRGDGTHCSALLAQLLRDHTLYVNFGMVDAKGVPVCSGLPLTRQFTTTDRAWFQRAVSTRQFAIGDYQISRLTDKAVLPFGYPLFDTTGQLQGVLYAAVDLAWVNRLVAAAQLPENAVLTLTDQNGTILTHHPDPQHWVGKAVPEPLFHAVRARSTRGLVEAVAGDAIARLYAVAPLPGVPGDGLFLAVGVPKDAAFAEVNRSLLRNLLGLGLVSLLALLAVWVGSDRLFQRPVHALIGAAKGLAAGDPEARRGLPVGRGELGDLGRTFDQMAEALSGREAELRAAEARYRRLFEEAPVGIYRTTPAGQILDANQALVEMHGYADRETFLAVNAATLYANPEDRRRWQALVERTEGVQDFEVQIRRPDGAVIWARNRGRAVWGPDGGVLYYEGTHENITERKQAAEALRQSEEKFRTLAETGPAATIIYQGSRLRYVNTAAATLTGYTREELLAMNFWDIIHPEFRELVRARGFARQRGEAVAPRYEIKLLTKEGEERWVDVHAGTIDFEGRTAAIVIASDISDRKQAEEALRRSEKLALMGELLVGVAHELNNPLAVVTGRAWLIRQRSRDDSVVQDADKLNQAAARCARIVKNFLTLARQSPPERSEVGLPQVVEEAVELLAYPLRVDNVEVELDLGPCPALWADPHQLHQVIINLITNAHHAMRETPPPRRLTVTLRHEAARGSLVLTVADTGHGIPAEIQARIFEPFFTTKPPGQGTGFGLSLCQSIVEEHGGRISVESSPGHGAVFRVELPITAPPLVPREPPTPTAGVPLRGKTILVVDDEPAVTELLSDILALDGHRVETAPTAMVALTKIRDRAYDVILSDLRMPGLDGPGLYREVVRRHPNLGRRFAFITGDSFAQATREFLAEAGVPSLGKPFTLEEVRRVVAQALGADGATAEPGSLADRTPARSPAP